jgi:hypothetical protein
LLDPEDGGAVFQYPQIVGTNIGAEIPFSFYVRGDLAHEYKTLLDAPGKAAFNGNINYYYVGTTRPWALEVTADLSKVHSYMNQKFSGGYFWARADVNIAVEELRRQEWINIKVWDENDKVVENYKTEKIVDKLLEKIIEAAFDKHDDVAPDKSEAKDSGQRFWWWSGSYSYKSSSASYSDIFNFRMTIYGKSEPIPVSIGFYVTVPSYGTCTRKLILDDLRYQLRRQIDTLGDEQLFAAANEFNLRTSDFDAEFDF